MSVMREKTVLERTVTTVNGRTILHERRIYGVLDVDGTFHLRAYRQKRFSVRQEPDGAAKNGNRVA